MKKYILKEILHVTSNDVFTWGKITNVLNSNNIILESEDIISIIKHFSFC
jgi:putative heme iron utilization protein